MICSTCRLPLCHSRLAKPGYTDRKKLKSICGICVWFKREDEMWSLSMFLWSGWSGTADLIPVQILPMIGHPSCTWGTWAPFVTPWLCKGVAQISCMTLSVAFVETLNVCNSDHIWTPLLNKGPRMGWVINPLCSVFRNLINEWTKCPCWSVTTCCFPTYFFSSDFQMLVFSNWFFH